MGALPQLFGIQDAQTYRHFTLEHGGKWIQWIKLCSKIHFPRTINAFSTQRSIIMLFSHHIHATTAVQVHCSAVLSKHAAISDKTLSLQHMPIHSSHIGIHEVTTGDLKSPAALYCSSTCAATQRLAEKHSKRQRALLPVPVNRTIISNVTSAGLFNKPKNKRVQRNATEPTGTRRFLAHC